MSHHTYLSCTGTSWDAGYSIDSGEQTTCSYSQQHHSPQLVKKPSRCHIVHRPCDASGANTVAAPKLFTGGNGAQGLPSTGLMLFPFPSSGVFQSWRRPSIVLRSFQFAASGVLCPVSWTNRHRVVSTTDEEEPAMMTREPATAVARCNAGVPGITLRTPHGS